MSYLEKINACNTFDIHQFIPVILNQQTIGWTYPSFAKALTQWPDIFKVEPKQVSIIAKYDNPQTLSSLLAPIFQTLHQNHIIDSWVGEDYSVVQTFGEPAQFYIERAATTYLGIRSFGVHVNGLVKTKKGLHVWIATRARDKPFWPGKYDQIVAGGQPAHLGLLYKVFG